MLGGWNGWAVLESTRSWSDRGHTPTLQAREEVFWLLDQELVVILLWFNSVYHPPPGACPQGVGLPVAFTSLLVVLSCLFLLFLFFGTFVFSCILSCVCSWLVSRPLLRVCPPWGCPVCASYKRAGRVCAYVARISHLVAFSIFGICICRLKEDCPVVASPSQNPLGLGCCGLWHSYDTGILIDVTHVLGAQKQANKRPITGVAFS
jgi:hypothetical protein